MLLSVCRLCLLVSSVFLCIRSLTLAVDWMIVFLFVPCSSDADDGETGHWLPGQRPRVWGGARCRPSRLRHRGSNQGWLGGGPLSLWHKWRERERERESEGEWEGEFYEFLLQTWVRTLLRQSIPRPALTAQGNDRKDTRTNKWTSFSNDRESPNTPLPWHTHVRTHARTHTHTPTHTDTHTHTR